MLTRRKFLLHHSSLLVTSSAFGAAVTGVVYAQSAPGARVPTKPLTPVVAKPDGSITKIGVAIDKSGRQRMLSQRMAKAYAQLLNGTIIDRSQRILRESIASFDASLTALIAFAPDVDTKTALDAQRVAWLNYRNVLDNSVSASGLREVISISGDVLKTAEAATGALSKLSGTPSGRAVNLSGRQRMLSQRIAKCFAFEVANRSKDEFSKEMDEASKQFVAAMKELDAFPQNNDYIKQMLVVAHSQWAFYERSLKPTDPTRVELASEHVAKASENILQTMDSITEQYSLLAG